MGKFIDITGRTFGKLIVKFRDGNVGPRWICECTACGTIKSFHSQKLRLGKARSCGCLRGYHSSESKKIHGMKRTPEYKSWCHMKSRCTNFNDPNYPNYGGRGITIYAPWINDFSLFFAEVGLRPGPGYTIDRINNATGNYEPGNVRWATKQTQNRNRRDNVHLVSRSGKGLLLCEWAECLLMNYATLRKLLKNGWFII